MPISMDERDSAASSSAAPFEPQTLRVAQRSRTPFFLFLALAAAGIFAVVLALSRVDRTLPKLDSLFGVLMGGLASFVIGTGGALFTLIAPRWRERDALVAASGRRVTFDGVALTPHVSGARVDPEAGGGRWTVSLFAGARTPTAFVYLRTLEDAEAFVVASTPRLDGEVLTFRFAIGRTRASTVSAVVLFIGAIAWLVLVNVGQIGSPIGMLAMIPGILLSAVPLRAEVGSDGIAFRWIGSSFIPFSSIEGAKVEDRALILVLRNGQTRRLLAADRRDTNGVRSLVALAARIEQRKATNGTSLTALCARLELHAGDRPLWIRELRAIATDAYRHAAVDPQQLWNVLGDSDSSANARIGAAMILREGLDDAGVERLRSLANTSMSADLRNALTRVADDRAPLGAEPR